MGKFQPGNKYGRWRPGQSGNPGGKPKALVEVAAAARACTLEMLETLKTVARDKKAPASARVSAAIALLERGWGKAPQSIEISRKDDLRNLSDEELIAIASEPATNGGEDPAGTPGDPEKLN